LIKKKILYKAQDAAKMMGRKVKINLILFLLLFYLFFYYKKALTDPKKPLGTIIHLLIPKRSFVEGYKKKNKKFFNK
jgi:hypothetical protein